MEDLRRLGELGASGTDDPSHSQEIQDKIWRSRLVRAQAGDRAGGIFRHLQQDFPTSKTPWQHYLRQYLTQAMLQEREPNWSKPSRRSVGLLDQNIEIFEPGIRSKPGLKRAGLVIDTSGSIDDNLLHQFVAEVQTIQTQTGCEVYLISADAQVQTEDLIRSYKPGLITLIQRRQIQLKGGGGTDFRPALDCLKSKSIQICIYLTDLMGTFPERAPNYDVIWASTSPHLSTPFGRVIFLE
jgi:predicted metal-dependent peptidase